MSGAGRLDLYSQDSMTRRWERVLGGLFPVPRQGGLGA